MLGGWWSGWGGLTLPDGSAFEVMPWERKFCELLANESGDLGLSVGRGNGKTGFVAGACGGGGASGRAVAPEAGGVCFGGP